MTNPISDSSSVATIAQEHAKAPQWESVLLTRSNGSAGAVQACLLLSGGDEALEFLEPVEDQLQMCRRWDFRILDQHQPAIRHDVIG